MTDPTIREALTEQAAGFEKLEAAVFTTFNFNPEFFEDNALPTLFGVESRREGSRRNLVNDRLLSTEVCVLYDASTRPSGGGPYRYQRVGVFRPGAFFHPKLTLLAGQHLDDHRPRVHLTVSSANLTLSGWGKNQEIIGEAWIGSQRQVLHAQVREALEWLRDNAAGKTRERIPAIDRCLAVLDDMGSGTNTGATTGAHFYFSPLHTDGFFPFLRGGQAGQWDELTAFSPFWGEVAAQAKLAASRKVRLVPALIDNVRYGLSRKTIPEPIGNLELAKLSRQKEIRFWHAKIYLLSRGDRARIGIGSANFTGAGLRGGEGGNIEAMLVYDADGGEAEEFAPSLAKLALDDPQIPERPPGDAPQPAPLQIEVVYDWKAREYRVFFAPAENPDIGGYRLDLPGLEPFALESRIGAFTRVDPRGPVTGSSFRLHYLSGGAPMTFDGLINELNVDLGDKPYFRPLSLLEILESWRLPGDSAALTKETASRGDPEPDEGEGEEIGTDIENEQAPGFDVLNLYELYRSFHELNKRMQEAEGEPIRLLGHLVTRPDSVYRVARQAAESSTEHPLPRFLLLIECQEVMKNWWRSAPDLDRKVRDDVRSWVKDLRETVRKLPARAPAGVDPAVLSEWLEDELKRAWRT